MRVGRKRQNQQLTPLELKIMKVLWDLGPATVQAVQHRLPGQPRLAYTTVQTMLNILHRKGKVDRALKQRAYEYRATLSRHKAARQTIRDVVDRLFGGSAESLVMSLVESRQLSPERLAELTRLVEQSQRLKLSARKAENREGKG
jgi:BlaI family transcriptional regulator, penicillinase repressor